MNNSNTSKYNSKHMELAKYQILFKLGSFPLSLLMLCLLLQNPIYSPFLEYEIIGSEVLKIMTVESSEGLTYGQ